VRVLGVVALLWIAMTSLASAADAIEFDQATRTYLEGVWLMGKEPDKGPCILGGYSDYQWEFEFRRSGGRILYYEPADFYVPVSIAAAKRNGSDLQITIAARGKEIPLSLRILSQDKMQEIEGGEPQGAPKQPDPKSFWYRCGSPDQSVNAATSTELLRVLSTLGREDVWFRELQPGVSDEELCSLGWLDRSSKAPKAENGFLKFEVFGPVHYYVWGGAGDGSWHHRLSQARILSVVQVAKDTLQLTISESWKDLRPFPMNVVWDGKYIFVPQMNRSFVRCSADHSFP
jgi:hypothetical protein